MKTMKIFAFAAMALSLSLTGCKDDEPAIPSQVIQRGDSACRIVTFTLNLDGGEEITGDVYDYDKSIDLLYYITQLPGLNSATAKVTLSEGASISPDPAVERDYFQPVSFTVTAKDGTMRTYTTKANEKVVNTYTKVGKLIEKGATELGVGNPTDYTSVGVSGDNVVVGDKVFNGKTLASVGNLNMTGITGKIAWLTNDEAGHLVASVTADGNPESTPVSIYMWKDGYNASPEIILGPSESRIAKFLSVSGNLTEGTALMTAMGGYADTGPHFCWEFIDGVRTNYYGLTTGIANGTDNGWGQMISVSTGDMAGQWFVWDSPGTSANGGAAAGHVVMTWSGWDGTGTPPDKVQINGILAENGGGNGWGNLRVGSIRAFTFNNTAYAAVLTEGWGSTYTSIVSADGQFLLNPNETLYAVAHNGSQPAPVAAYVLNTSDNCGYVYTFESEQKLVVYKLEIAIE